jgi:hypothetical protein
VSIDGLKKKRKRKRRRKTYFLKKKKKKNQSKNWNSLSKKIILQSKHSLAIHFFF